MHPRLARLILAAAAAIVLGYVVVSWTQTRVPTDFAQQYVAGTLFRDGHGADLYDAAAQAAVRHRVLPASAGSLEFGYPPPIAAAVAPLTLLGPPDAFRVWSAAQLALLIAAAVIAARAVPQTAGRSERLKLFAIAAASCAGFGTGVLVALGQIDGVQAVGVALAYSQWRRERYAWGGFWLAMTAASVKPHLALGLAAFVVGWQDRRVLRGAASGVVAALAGYVAIAGVGGIATFVRGSVSQIGAWHLATMPATVGLAGSWLGDTATAQAFGLLGSVAAIVLASVLGRALRRDTSRLEPAFVGAVVLSQLAALHTYVYDLALLAPAATVAMATAMSRDETTPRPGRSRLAIVGGLWLAINLAAYVDAQDAAHAPPGQLTAWVLLVAAAVAIRATIGHGHPATTRHDVRGVDETSGASMGVRAAHPHYTGPYRPSI